MKVLIASLTLILFSNLSFGSLSQSDENENLINDPRAEYDLEVFVVDEEELGVSLEDLSDEEIFGEYGLISELIEYEATAARNNGRAVRKGPRAQARSCAAPKNGVASYYADAFHGKKTANGERFNMNEMTAAHKTIAFHSLVKVTYKGKSVIVRINDAGPYSGNRVIDLSKAAAKKLGMIRSGKGKVTLTITRCGKSGKKS